MAKTVNTDTSVSTPRSTPARSLTKNQCLSSSPLNEFTRGTENVGISGSAGDWVGPPPGMCANVKPDR
jgi:hypothetical protein